MLKKHTLNSEMTLLCQFHVQKALFYVPKSPTSIFASHHDLPKGIRNVFSEKKDEEDRTDSSIQAQNINEGSEKTVMLYLV